MPLIERVLDRSECRSLDGHLARGGGRGLEAARAAGAESTIEVVEASGLRGRGGAGFPTGRKWRTVVSEPLGTAPPVVVVNAAEGEPGTFKDRQLIRMNPYKVLEGALIAAVAMGADDVVVAAKHTFRRELAALRRAIAELDASGWTDGVAIRIVEGPTEYLFGEETALLEVVSGRRPFPRIAPPWRRGLDDGAGATGATASDVALVGDEPFADTAVLVGNVETLSNLPGILAEGADWFRSVGTEQSPGTIICTMTGHCATHAVGEVPMGTTLREAIELIGGGAAGTRIIGALSGVANPIVDEEHLDTPLTHEDMRAIGSGLGSAGFFVIDDRTDVVALAAGAARFLSIESCGQCDPCKRDGLAMARSLASLTGPTPNAGDLEAIPARLDTVTYGARCGLATEQQVVLASALELFPEAFTRRAAGDRSGAAEELVLPLVDIVEGRAVLDTSHLTKQPDWTHDAVDSGTVPFAIDMALHARNRAAETVVHVPERNVRAAAAIATGRDPLPAALGPICELITGLRGQLDDLIAEPDGSAMHELRRQLDVYVDVSERIVHPWASRAEPGAADDDIWQAELDELAMEREARADDERFPDAAELHHLVERIRSILDRDEDRILDLAARLDEVHVDELGAGVSEAVATSQVGRS